MKLRMVTFQSFVAAQQNATCTKDAQLCTTSSRVSDLRTVHDPHGRLLKLDDQLEESSHGNDA